MHLQTQLLTLAYLIQTLLHTYLGRKTSYGHVGIYKPLLYYVDNKAARIPCRRSQLCWPLFILITTKIRQLRNKPARVTTKFNVTALS
ncbi:hypothetical protein F4813DRAFT_113522 [Daldinia decipiens]|uniref:uncharacterized protein n=1 Tax=Daldinia decipiens TaxID=326647 RepID=UPI0020C40212|nr:uncharacterized protein F4813DRAFT_113522 [Daldinia decipiens]KAI1656863.1 hypothetical protein F4813DRAFT_113522 [Daldinia decipiens]